ncbi:MAG: alanine--tRNA ligase-related protein, partial [Planctomycetota bacterium]|nr:alanine--tRNA ligase-related protein [Planctomycetota bacterium]
IGIREAFLFKLVAAVARVMKKQYPEIEERSGNIARFLKAEEEKYAGTVEEGSKRLVEIAEKLVKNGKTVFPGEEAFILYDTFGFPVEKAEAFLASRGITLDTAGFKKAMESQKAQARAGSSIASTIFASGPLRSLKETLHGTEFVGYDTTLCDGKIVGILRGDELMNELHAPAKATILLDKTCFYGESGGQTGDTGTMMSSAHGEMEFVVENTRREDTFVLHEGNLRKGWLRIGDTVNAGVDLERRRAGARAHTATHLLQNALRAVLGKHVEQAGSLVAPDRLRFDFAHFASLSTEELSRVEELVNSRVVENEPVTTVEESFESAKKLGALTVPGERYAERVRMVSVGEYSRELCGGTHVRRAGDIGLFIITGSSAVAAGVRRIEALTGHGALKEIARLRTVLARAADAARVTPNHLAGKIESMFTEIKELKQEAGRARRQDADHSASAAVANAKVVGGEKFVCEKYDSVSLEELRNRGDAFVKKEKCGAAFLLSVVGEKIDAVLVVRAELAGKKANAGAWLKDIMAKVGGSGGGRPDMAQGGFKDKEKVEAAIQRFAELVDDLAGK